MFLSNLKLFGNKSYFYFAGMVLFENCFETKLIFKNIVWNGFESCFQILSKPFSLSLNSNSKNKMF
jgi:hypothetical protein